MSQGTGLNWSFSHCGHLGYSDDGGSISGADN